MASMEKSVQRRLGLIVGAGLVSLVITLAGYYWFLTAEWFSTTDWSNKSTWGGYTLWELVGLCLFVLFNPIAFTYLFVAAQTFIRHYADVSTKAVTWAAVACVAICLAFCIYGITNSYYFLECMGVGCVGPDLIALLVTTKALSNLSLSVYGWKVTIGVSLLLVCLSFAGMYVAVAFRERNLKKAAPRDEASAAEAERLAPSESSSDEVVAPHHPRSAWRWLAYGAYVLAMMIWWVPTTIIPASWEYFEPSRIAYAAAQYASEDTCGALPPRACAELEGATWTTSNIAVSEYFVMKIFPSSVIFFAFWIITPGLALLAYDIKVVHRFLQRKLRLCGSSYFSYGEVAAFTIFSLMIAFWSYYWFHDHNFHGRSTHRTAWEKAYRGSGQVAVLVMAVLMLPAARSGILGAFFRVSWEATIQYHRWLGVFWLVTVVAHIVFYWIYAAVVTDTFAIDFFPLHFTGSLDNFTVPLQIVFTYISIVTIGVFAFFDFFRRKFFELFFYTHHISYCFLILTVLWHASASWMYLMPALAVWFADRVLRAYRSNRSVKVLKLRARDCGKAGLVTEIECEVAGGMPYKAGQYAFLNIAELSILEWHPFTIASATASRMTFLIKAMGEGEATWTRRLYVLAKAQQDAIKEGGTATKLTLCVDGPNGEPIDLRHYRSVLLVCGGIGVTPCASLLDAIRKQPKPSPSVHLLWVARDASLCTLLGDSLAACARPLDADALAAHPDHEQPAVTASLFVAGVHAKPQAEQIPVHVTPVPVATVVHAATAAQSPVAGAGPSPAGVEEKQAVQARAVSRLQHAGRPATDAAWTATLEPLAARAVPGESARQTAQRTLMFVCGPNTMIEQMEAIAYNKGWSFHTEVFDL